MSPDEYQDWIAFYNLEPWGSQADDSRFQVLCDVIHRTNSTERIEKSLVFFDRDPEETARLEAIERARTDRLSALDAKIEAYFERRLSGGS